MRVFLHLVCLLSIALFVDSVPGKQKIKSLVHWGILGNAVANYEAAEDEVSPDEVQMDEADEASKRQIIASTGKYDVPTPEPPNILSFGVDRCEPNSIKKKVLKIIPKQQQSETVTRFSIFRTAIAANADGTDKAGFVRGEIVRSFKITWISRNDAKVSHSSSHSTPSCTPFLRYQWPKYFWSACQSDTGNLLSQGTQVMHH